MGKERMRRMRRERVRHTKNVLDEQNENKSA